MKNILKHIYNFIPFKMGFFSILKYFWSPNERTYKHLHFIGVFKVKIDSQKSFKIKHHGFQVENDIFWSGLTGRWEKISLGLWIKLCENADVVFDIGANTGIYSLIAKAQNKKATVYALEPVKRVFEKLVINNEINDFNIKCLPVAASNYKGKAVIYDTDASHTYSVTVNKNLNPEIDGALIAEIDVNTLDNIITEEKITKIDLIKIDVETHEPEVLEGFVNHIRLFKPTILIEILNNEVGEKVEKIITGLDYLYFNIDETKGIKQIDKITKSDYFNYLLCTKEVAKKLGL
jgi:FkbM family methyltransferase